MEVVDPKPVSRLRSSTERPLPPARRPPTPAQTTVAAGSDGSWHVRYLVLTLVLVAVLGAGAFVAYRYLSHGSLVWSDEFNGTAGAPADPRSWAAVTGGNGWGNRELQCYTNDRANSSLDGHGHLMITARYEPDHLCADGTRLDYTSARLTTANLRTLGAYGRLEVRASLPTASATWPAFWAVGQDHDTVGWPASGEIDVVETVGMDPGVVYGTVHGPSAFTDRTGRKDFQLGGRTALTPGWHTYSASWSRDSITFSADGTVYTTVSRPAVTAVGTWTLDQPVYLLLNLAVGGSFGGAPDATATWPQTYLVDWVRFFSR